MKVVFAVRRYHPNMIPIVRALRSHGCSVTVFCSAYESGEDYTDVEPIFMEPSGLSFARARSLLNDFNTDLLVIRHWRDGFWKLGYIAKIMRIKTIYYDQESFCRKFGVCGFFEDLKKVLVRLICTASLCRMTPVKCGGNGRASLYSLFFPYPVIPDGLARSRGYSKSNPIVLCVGKLAQPRKRHHWLLKAVEALGTECRIILVGAGDDSLMVPQKRSVQYYRNILSSANLQGKCFTVEIMQDVPYAKMTSLYRQADIFVLPSEREPFAISPLEAMASGCAVLCPNGNGSSALITDGYDGSIFREESFSDFVEKLQGLLSSQYTAKRLGQNAAKTIRMRHSYVKFYRFIEAYLEELDR